MSVRDSDKSNPYIPLASLANDGYHDVEKKEATATCFCGAVQLAFNNNQPYQPMSFTTLTHVPPTDQPTEGPGLLFSFVCHCTDCRKITASMFTSAFAIADTHLKHLRGRENLTQFTQKHTIASGLAMSNYFCKTCGSLMYRTGPAAPNAFLCRLGTVDDFNLVEQNLAPQLEVYVKDRVSWCGGVQVQGVKQFDGQAGA
ncbi:hypothetical protein T440DRAFT_508580 [Plenodomus tracheiphilus IPT5]|uniref:CENP-V/GFA domain-containing protein n=1 Tax=Plenodomus tracheiphilus IPT5 TaxID=1408161 RepID=A0A6A7B2N2_9PLEO|nr:hypothetical protein T440DRAFT_508580 [Plenodomus tracheiphilus IPT5]